MPELGKPRAPSSDLSGAATESAVLQGNAVRGASWTLIHTATSIPIAFIGNLLLARFLGIEDYGRLAFLTLLMAVASGVIEIGLSSGTLQFGSREHAAGNTTVVGRILSSAQGFRLLLVAPVLTLLVVSVADVDATFLVVAVIFGIWIPALLDGALFSIIIEGKSDVSARLAILTNIIVQIGTVSVAAITRSPDAVWSTRLILSGLMIAAYLIPISPAYRRAVLRPRLPVGFPAGFWRFALPTGAAGLIATLALSRSEVFFLTALSTPAAVGTFALAFGLASHIFAPADALVGPLMPAVAGLHRTAPETLARALTRVLRASSTAIALACVCGLPALALMVPLLYGEQFEPAAPLLLALGIGGGFLALGGPLSAFTLARLASTHMLVANCVALAIDVALAVLLIPPFGAWGAVAANLSGALARLVILAAGEVRHTDLTWRDLTTSCAPVVFSPLIALTIYGSLSSMSLHALVAAGTAAVVGLTALLMLLAVTGTGLTREDAVVILRHLPRALRRPVTPLVSLLARRR